MSTLTMALAAVLVAGSGPEKVSGEVEQRLDLRGVWEGTYEDEQFTYAVRIERQHLRTLKDQGIGSIAFLWTFTEAREGKCRVETFFGPRHGIYKTDGDRVTLCIRLEEGPPTSFRIDEDQVLLTLRRVRPRK